MTGYLSFALIVAFFLTGIAGQTCNDVSLQPPKGLWPSDTIEGQFAGHYIKVFGNRVVAGAYGHTRWTGAVYVYRREGTSYVQEAKLLAPDGEDYAYLGLNVDMNNDFVVAGAPYARIRHNSRRFTAGKAYIWRRSGFSWSLVATLQAPDPNGGMRFGYSVALSQEFVFIGARYADNNIADVKRAGAVYVYRGAKNDLRLAETLRGGHTDVHWSDELVYANGVLVVGAPRRYRGEGAAYVFEVQSDRTFAPSGTLRHTPPSGMMRTRDDHMAEGITIAPNGSYIVIAGERAGSPRCSTGGAAYVFRKDSSGEWVQRGALFPDQCGDNRFGQRVTTANNVIVVGSWNEVGSNGLKTGSVYVFGACENGQWRQVRKIPNPVGGDHDEFGKCVHMDFNNLIVGCPQCDRGSQTDVGSVQVYPFSFSRSEAVTSVSARAPDNFIRGTLLITWVNYTIVDPGMEIVVQVRDASNTRNLAQQIFRDIRLGGVRRSGIRMRLPADIAHNTRVILRTHVRPIGGTFANSVAQVSSSHTVMGQAAYVQVTRVPRTVTAGRSFDALLEYISPVWFSDTYLFLTIFDRDTRSVIHQRSIGVTRSGILTYRSVSLQVGTDLRGKSVDIRLALRRQGVSDALRTASVGNISVV